MKRFTSEPFAISESVAQRGDRRQCHVHATRESENGWQDQDGGCDDQMTVTRTLRAQPQPIALSL